MIHVWEIAAFALATFGESINPGPTLAALVSARTRSRLESWGVVFGVGRANIAWVIIVFSLRLFGSQLPPWPAAEPLLKAFAAFILVFIATRAAAWAVVTGAESYILKNWSAPMATASASSADSFAGGVSRGFSIHFFNPLSLTYYFGAYTGTLVSDPPLAFIFSIVAVLVDFIVYGILASLPVGRLLTSSPATFVAQRAFSLLASFAMLFLVAHVFAIDRGLNAPSELHALRNLLMLLGFLAGTICEAENFAVRYSKNKNKLLWRGVLVWQSAFGAFAIIGTFLSVLWRIDPDSFGFDKSLISAMAICSLVAAVATAALSYARARGEMLNEAEFVSSSGNAENVTQTLSLNNPRFVFPALLGGFVVLFAFFVISGFSDKFGR
jgi:hypothetical protein